MRPYWYLGDGKGLTRLKDGEIFFVCTATRDISTWILLGGVWETFVDDILCSLARPGDTFLDVGANMGYYTIKVGTKVGPTGKVFAVEPNPELCRILVENIDINGRSAYCHAFNIAAGAAVGESVLTFRREASGGGSVLMPGEQAPEGALSSEVSVAALDEVLPPGCRLDLVKVDVEGYEPGVFRGMVQLLNRSPDCAIVTEVSLAHWARWGDAALILKDLAVGREVFRIHHDGTLEELPFSSINERLDTNFVSYLLFLPRGSSRRTLIEPFLRRRASDPLSSHNRTFHRRLWRRLCRSLQSRPSG